MQQKNLQHQTQNKGSNGLYVSPNPIFAPVEAVWEQYLQSLRADLIIYKEAIRETARDMIEEGYTSFPIFVAHQLNIQLGEPILDHRELGTNWTIHASHLEEFIEKGLVLKERESLFRETFKNPDEFACMFVVSPEGARFVFIPYASTQKTDHAAS